MMHGTASVHRASRKEQSSPMTKSKKWKKVHHDPNMQYRLFQSITDPMAFEARLPMCRGNTRRRFRAPSLLQAVSDAPVYLGLVARDPSSTPVRIVDAFNEALEASRRGRRSRRDWARTVKAFMAFLPPELEYWHQITRKHLRQYLATFDGKSDTTRRLALQPVVQTARFMAREYELPDRAQGLRLGSENAKPTPRVYVRDVLGLLEHLREKASWYEAGAALQGLVGLRLTEAQRLTWDRIDFERGLIEISGEVKNKWSVRVIPVCSRVCEALERHRKLPIPLKVQTIDNRLYPMHVDNYGSELNLAIRGWNAKIPWRAKDLRNLLPQLALELGVLNAVWEEYIGHSPRGVTARHYLARLSTVSEGEKEAQEKQMAHFRTQVLNPLEKSMRNAGFTRKYNLTASTGG